MRPSVGDGNPPSLRHGEGGGGGGGSARRRHQGFDQARGSRGAELRSPAAPAAPAAGTLAIAVGGAMGPLRGGLAQALGQAKAGDGTQARSGDIRNGL